MKVVWSKEALRRLIEIEEYISLDNPERAVHFVDRLIERAEQIKDYPYQGRVVPEFAVNEIREVFVKTYRIVYRISENSIEILTVYEGHKLLKSSEILKKRP